MTPALRQDIIDALVDRLHETMFGDGFEEQYIRDGIDFKGLNHMSDQELVDEFETSALNVDIWTCPIEDFEAEFRFEDGTLDGLGVLIQRIRQEHPTRDTLSTAE